MREKIELQYKEKEKKKKTRTGEKERNAGRGLKGGGGRGQRKEKETMHSCILVSSLGKQTSLFQRYRQKAAFIILVVTQ